MASERYFSLGEKEKKKRRNLKETKGRGKKGGFLPPNQVPNLAVQTNDFTVRKIHCRSLFQWPCSLTIIDADAEVQWNGSRICPNFVVNFNLIVRLRA